MDYVEFKLLYDALMFENSEAAYKRQLQLYIII